MMALVVSDLGSGWREIAARTTGRTLGYVRERLVEGGWEWLTFDDSASGVSGTEADAIAAVCEYAGQTS